MGTALGVCAGANDKAFLRWPMCFNCKTDLGTAGEQTKFIRPVRRAPRKFYFCFIVHRSLDIMSPDVCRPFRRPPTIPDAKSVSFQVN